MQLIQYSANFYKILSNYVQVQYKIMFVKMCEKGKLTILGNIT